MISSFKSDMTTIISVICEDYFDKTSEKSDLITQQVIMTLKRDTTILYLTLIIYNNTVCYHTSCCCAPACHDTQYEPALDYLW